MAYGIVNVPGASKANIDELRVLIQEASVSSDLTTVTEILHANSWEEGFMPSPEDVIVPEDIQSPYYQEISVSGITANDTPWVDLVPSNDFETAVSQCNDWAKVYRMVTSTGKISVYAVDLPEVDLTIQIKW